MPERKQQLLLLLHRKICLTATKSLEQEVYLRKIRGNKMLLSGQHNHSLPLTMRITFFVLLFCVVGTLAQTKHEASVDSYGVEVLSFKNHPLAYITSLRAGALNDNLGLLYFLADKSTPNVFEAKFATASTYHF